jgi:hypothetical protein
MNKRTIVMLATVLILGIAVGGLAGYNKGLNERPKQVANTLLAEGDMGRGSIDEALRNTKVPCVDFEDNSLMEIISLLQCRTFEMNRESGGVQIAIGHPLVHDSQLADMSFTLQARDQSIIEILDKITQEAGFKYSIRPCVVLWGKEDPTKPN